MRVLHRAGGDFITQSVTHSDHISGGQRRSAHRPYQPPGTGPGGCGAPPSHQCAGAGLGPPRHDFPSHGSPGMAARALCGVGITPNSPLSFPPGRGAAATSLADHPGIAKGSKGTLLGLLFFPTCLPSPEQPCIPLQGQLLLCSPSVRRVCTWGEPPPSSNDLFCGENPVFHGVSTYRNSSSK